MAGVTLRLSARRVTTAEEDAIIHAATNKNRMERSNFSNIKQSVTAEEKIQDVETLIKTTRRQTEPLIHCSCFLELTAPTMEELRSLRDEVNAILIRSKLGTDPLLLRQRDGFLSSNPAGQNAFGSFAERVLPASSVANLYPISYSGKTDPMGFLCGPRQIWLQCYRGSGPTSRRQNQCQRLDTWQQRSRKNISAPAPTVQCLGGR